MIIKPSEFTPASSIRLAQLAHEAGLPDGVFNVAPGLGQTVGAALTPDRRVGKVSFIGSVPTGRRVAVAAAQAGIPALLELGGKSANIVFADADLERAADGAISAIFSGRGAVLRGRVPAPGGAERARTGSWSWSPTGPRASGSATR